MVQEYRDEGIEKPVVASLAGDVEVEEASQYLFDHGIVAYPYTTEKPVAVLGAKYRWAGWPASCDRDADDGAEALRGRRRTAGQACGARVIDPAEGN